MSRVETEALDIEQPDLPSHGISFREALGVWTKVAALSFGGPAGQIAVMHRILVEEKKWIGETRFLHALNFCMLLPGPEAQQLAVYIGWLLHKTKGGLVAGTLFVLPGLISIMVLSWIYAAFGNVGVVQALFFGLKAAVLAIVLEAVVRIGRRSLKNNIMIGLAAAAFIAIFFYGVPFPVIILAAGIIGLLGGHFEYAAFQPSKGHGKIGRLQVADANSALGEDIPTHAWPTTGWSLKIAAVFLVLWLGPVIALLLTLGTGNVFSQIAVFFSKMAVVTFGGAYAVLAYVAQEAVETYGWLKPGEMLDGLGMAETTPGPPDHGIAIRRIHGGVSRPGCTPPDDRRHARRPTSHLGYLYALLPLDISWRALCRGVAREQRLERRIGYHHGGSSRRRSQPRSVVRAPRAICRTCRDAMAWDEN